MPQANSQKLEQDILRRLSAVDVTACLTNKPVVACALEKYLNALGLAPRPIRWAKDAQHAQDLAAQSNMAAVQEELHINIVRILGDSAERTDTVWWKARDKAREAGHSRPLEIAKGLVRGYDVLFSVPWSLYSQRLTGDRGRRVSPECVTPWNAVEDALEYAARASAESAWAHDESHEASDQHHVDVWLPFVDAFEAGLWCFWITASDVIALPRPTLQLDAERLHAARGPAISWPDGEQQFFFLNGVRVPSEIVEVSAHELEPRLILRERNAEVRREIVRKIGIERICQELEAQCLDRQGNYELLLLDLQDGRTRPFLKMRNPSIGVYHIEGVAPECRTVAEALAWRNQSDVPPSVLT
jgi:hypothetical protein